MNFGKLLEILAKVTFPLPLTGWEGIESLSPAGEGKKRENTT
jgi:hypothetical protein